MQSRCLRDTWKSEAYQAFCERTVERTLYRYPYLNPKQAKARADKLWKRMHVKGTKKDKNLVSENISSHWTNHGEDLPSQEYELTESKDPAKESCAHEKTMFESGNADNKQQQLFGGLFKEKIFPKEDDDNRTQVLKDSYTAQRQKDDQGSLCSLFQSKTADTQQSNTENAILTSRNAVSTGSTVDMFSSLFDPEDPIFR